MPDTNKLSFQEKLFLLKLRDEDFYLYAFLTANIKEREKFKDDFNNFAEKLKLDIFLKETSIPVERKSLTHCCLFLYENKDEIDNTDLYKDLYLDNLGLGIPYCFKNIPCSLREYHCLIIILFMLKDEYEKELRDFIKTRKPTSYYSLTAFLDKFLLIKYGREYAKS